MERYFREFINQEEKKKASALIATIDQGEEWIFNGCEGSEEFGNFLEHLYFDYEDMYGTFSACIFRNNLRIQIGFSNDLPDFLEDELLRLILKVRNKVNTYTNIWYVTANQKLEDFIFHKLPWETKGHKTHELKAYREDFKNLEVIPPSELIIVPFDTKYTVETCEMLDKSMAHTYDMPDVNEYSRGSQNFGTEWSIKAKKNECCLMLYNEHVAGIYILNDAEIDILAMNVNLQNKGWGSIMLKHALKHIFETTESLPYLYCVENNKNALRFYLREGMKETAYSGYAYCQQIDDITMN